MFMRFETQLKQHIENPLLDGDERVNAFKCLEFLNDDSRCFERENLVGHFTGSAIIVDAESRSHMLMTFHRKLEKWLHLGGHCDGLAFPFVTAWTEAFEESDCDQFIR